MKRFFAIFLGLLMVLVCLADARAADSESENNDSGFTTGTGDDAIFRFPQIMSERCHIDAKEQIDYDTLNECFNKICSDTKAADSAGSEEGVKNLKEIIKEELINAFILSVKIKQKYASLKIEDRTDNNLMNQDGIRTQEAGSGDVNEVLAEQEEDFKRLREALVDMLVYKTFVSNPEVFLAKADYEEVVWEEEEDGGE